MTGGFGFAELETTVVADLDLVIEGWAGLQEAEELRGKASESRSHCTSEPRPLSFYEGISIENVQHTGFSTSGLPCRACGGI